MKLTDIESLSDAEQITQYIFECNGGGNMLPYNDMVIIKDWLDHADNVDQLLLILSDILPQHFVKKPGKKFSKSIASLHKVVMLKLKDSHP